MGLPTSKFVEEWLLLQLLDFGSWLHNCMQLYRRHTGQMVASILWFLFSCFTGVAGWPLAQTQLSALKAVCCWQFCLRLMLECLHWLSRWASHAITTRQSINSIIYGMELEDLVVLHLHYIFAVIFLLLQRNMCEGHTHRHRQTQNDYRIPLGLRPLMHNHRMKT